MTSREGGRRRAEKEGDDGAEKEDDGAEEEEDDGCSSGPVNGPRTAHDW